MAERPHSLPPTDISAVRNAKTILPPGSPSDLLSPVSRTLMNDKRKAPYAAKPKALQESFKEQLDRNCNK
jgi:hypothetical protein